MNRVLTVMATCIASGCAELAESPPPPAIDLVEITERTGIDLVTTCGNDPSTQIIDVNGPGLALLDMDGDGDLDLFVANGATPDAPEAGPGCRLYRNMLSESGMLSFEDATEDAGVTVTRWATGASAWDMDVDGDIDLYITCIGPDIVLHNDGTGRFEDATGHSGVDNAGWTTAAVPGDLDGDGDLDLYLVNYVNWDFQAPPPPPIDFRGTPVLAGPAGLPPGGDRVYLNRGDGSFVDATESTGLAAMPAAYGLNAVILDLEDDGTPEILVGNDGMANALLTVNDGPVLRDTGRARGFATNMAGAQQATMGLAIGDVDGDGGPDVFSTNFSSDTNTLLVSRDGFMVDRTNAMALGAPSRALLGWTTRLVDLDHDGDEDLLTLNGHVYPNASLETMGSTYRQPVLIQRRDGDVYTALDAESLDGWMGDPRVDRAGVMGDLDGDGDLDLVTAQLRGPIRIIENRIHNPDRRGVIIELRDERQGSGNPAGLGAHVVIEEQLQWQHRWMTPGTDFQGWSAPQVHVSLPADLIDTVFEVRWPDGTITRQVMPMSHRIILRRKD